MRLLAWIPIAAAAVALGVGVVQYLVAPPLEMSLYLLLCAGLAVGLVALVAFGLRGRARLLAGGLIVAGVAVGYLGATTVFLGTEEERDLPELALPAAEQRDHAAIIYRADGSFRDRVESSPTTG